MSRMSTPISLCALAIAGMTWVGSADAAVVISMVDSRLEFHEKGAGDTSGPFLDVDSGVSGTITTTRVTDSTGNPGAKVIVDVNGSQTGVTNTSITAQESWSFTWNVDAQLLQIDYSALSGTGVAGIQSDAWIGASITPGTTSAHFDSNTGTFTLDGDLPADTFTQSHLYGTGEVPVIPSGTEITLFSATGATYSIGGGFNWALTPEPATLSLLAGAAGAMLMRPRRRC